MKRILNTICFVFARILLPLTIFLLVSGHRSYAAAPAQLSLNDAIFLALRNNPNVQNAQLDLTLSKFGLYVQEWQFYPHYSIKGNAIWNRNIANANPVIGSHSYNIGPTITYETPIGTQFTFNQTNPKNSTYNPGVSLNIVQPLMKGFGRPIVEQALENARDSEVISRMNVLNVLRSTVSNVVSAYLDVVNAESSVKINQQALDRAKNSVEQTKKFIKAGHKAGNELVTVEANVASAESNLENAKNALLQSRYNLLSNIGIDPNTAFTFTSLDLDELTKRYSLPSLDDTKQLALQNDISYQTEVITLNGSKQRQLLSAQDNTRWQLDLNANITRGSASGGGQNSGFNSIINGYNQGQSVGLELTVPIDDQAAQQNLLSAKIGLQEARIALRKSKWDKETNAINNWNTVVSAKRSLQFAQSAEVLQQKTYDISYQKYLHGLIDSLELQSAQMQLIQAQQSLLNARISYIKALVNFDLLIGNTLKTWGVKTRIV